VLIDASLRWLFDLGGTSPLEDWNRAVIMLRRNRITATLLVTLYGVCL